MTGKPGGAGSSLLGLSGDCWVLVFSNLPPRDLIRARAVSTQWHRLLTDESVCRRLLQTIFPHCREARLDMLQNRIDDLPNMPHNLRVEVQCRAQQGEHWSRTFVAVARRYHHLGSGMPREYLKLPLPDMVDHTTLDDCPSHNIRSGHVCPHCRFKIAQCSHFFWMSVPVWPRTVDFRPHKGEFHFPDPMWWYSQEDGLLVYPASWLLDDQAPPSFAWTEIERKCGPKEDAFRNHFNPPEASCEGFIYRLFDPETGEHISVPFDVRGKIIRRVRLAQGVLILEWTEVHADKTLIDRSKVMKSKEYRQWAAYYRRTWYDYLARNSHMVTAFDVVRMPLSPSIEGGPGRSWTWEVRPRYEWQLPTWGPGCPGGGRSHASDDVSVHDYRPRFFSAHTATHYALFIWRAVLDEAGWRRFRRQLWVWDISPADHSGASSSSRSDNATSGKKPKQSAPTLIRRLVEPDIRYRHSVFFESERIAKLRNITMDEHNVYMVEEDPRWVSGDLGTSTVTHRVVSFSVPVVLFPPAEGDPAGPSPDRRSQVNNPVFGPHWVDDCPNGGTRHRFCRNFVHEGQRRHLRPPPVVAPYSSLPKVLLPSLRNQRYPWDGSDAVSNPLQPRNFPGFPPCWRHENFPFVGISAVTDYAAGVRWVARDSRPLNSMAPRLLPTVTVNISGSGVGNHASASEHGLTGDLEQPRHPFRLEPEPRNIRSDEVEVEYPGFWENMMGRMTLAGDERWLIGQDSENRITLVRF